MSRSNFNQYALIIAGLFVTILFGVFWLRELFPEYRIYQDDYIALENFRSTYTHEAPPTFKPGVKQIVMEREDKGPAEVDRCISCHVALQFPHFSPTKLATDINGNIELDLQGRPLQVHNENYVWDRLDGAIENETDPKQRKALQTLKTAKVGDRIYDVTKVLQMHPLMGRETRPFEFHPVEEYGCVSCHSGNGRGLTTEKAHGPVFDGEYEEEFTGPKPVFTEQDVENDPLFARMFNHKPGHELLFQTTPILIGTLIQAKCMDCHQGSTGSLRSAIDTAGVITQQRIKKTNAIRTSYQQEEQALIAIIELQKGLSNNRAGQFIANLKVKSQDYTLPQEQREQLASQYEVLSKTSFNKNLLLQQMIAILGSQELVDELMKQEGDPQVYVPKFLTEKRKNPEAKGTIFQKLDLLDFEQAMLGHVLDTQSSFEKSVEDEKVMAALVSDVDLLTMDFKRGQELYFSQACYACHRIAGLARGGVGPELTRGGLSYPWYIKESMVWPQADLVTSTMPNYHLDHEELQDLMTFLLAQKGETQAVSDTRYKGAVQEWEAGKKMPWEKPVNPDQIHDVRFGMTVFAEQGCAACHRLKGFESDVGYRDAKSLQENSNWFQALIPEKVTGSTLVNILETHSNEIDQRIVNGVREGSILEEIDKKIPDQIESLYISFKYAARAKNSYYSKKIAAAKNEKEKQSSQQELAQWKDRVHRVLMMFVQEYGLGRLVGPRPNWSGVYRSDEWLMEHFRSPTNHIPRSIMPVFPFDDSKFYALTYMLDVLGKKNRDELRAIWDKQGFNPAMAYKTLCAQCHGDFLQGNGPVAEWIYPIPKNLRNADFLRNLTRERVIYSIQHGVKGTPMPPWGEVGQKEMMGNKPVLTSSEIQHLTDWIFSSLPGGTVIRGSQDVPKWQYQPEDVIRELNEEGNVLKSSFGIPVGVEKIIVSLAPQAYDPVEQYFDRIKNPSGSPDPYAFFIKKKYYTSENLEVGKAFFELNCAVCHGKEADGTGARAGAMREAKPRMLVNIDWGNSRDDLRWLRSIKYGVQGTSMNPWGDLTSSLQRMQLVMYLRSLTSENRQREVLNETLYQTYEHSLLKVEESRIREYTLLDETQEKLEKLSEERENLYNLLETGGSPTEEATSVYQQELEAVTLLRQREEIDSTLKSLIAQIQKEKEVYLGVGLNLLGKFEDENTFANFLDVIKLNEGRYEAKDGRLSANFDTAKEEEMAAKGKQIVESINRAIAGKEGTIKESYMKIKNRVISGLEEAARARKEQQKIYNNYISQVKQP